MTLSARPCSEDNEVLSEESESEDDFIDGHSETYTSRCGWIECVNVPTIDLLLAETLFEMS